MNRNIKLNLLKGSACIGVVFMHIRFPGLFGQIVVRALAYAVPIFFMVAGYYACGKDTSVIKRRLFKIIKIFIVAYVLFFMAYGVGALVGHRANIWFAENFNWKTPIKYIVFCTIDYAIPLWYLIAMIEVYILWLMVVKWNKEELMLKIMVVLFLLQIALTMYVETKGLAWFWKTNFLTRGLSWFLLGYYLHTPKADKIKTISQYGLIVLVVIGCAITVIPTALDFPIKFTVIGYIPYALGLFLLALKDPYKSVCKQIEFIGDNLSLYIYISHFLIGGVLNFGLNKVGFPVSNILYLWVRPIVVLLLSMLMSWGIFLVKKKLSEKNTKKISL